MVVEVIMRLLLITLIVILAQVFSINHIDENQTPDIVVTRKDDDICVSWTPVDTSVVEDCFAIYEFRYQIDGADIINKILEGTSVTIPYTPSTEKTFIVSPRCRTDAVVAETTLKTYTTRIIECESLNMAVEIQPWPTARLSWDSGACALAYNISQYINGNIYRNVLIPWPVSISHLSWSYCTQNTIVMVIIPRSNAGWFAPERVDFAIGLNASTTVQNLQVNRIDNTYKATWSRPEESEACDVNYLVTVGIGNDTIYETKTNETSLSLSHVGFTPCSTAITLTVTPFDESSLGEPKTILFDTDRGNAGRIQDLTVNNSRVTWGESQHNGNCDVVYTVLVTEESGQETSYTTRNTFFDIDFVPCAMYNIIIISRIDGNFIAHLLTTNRLRPTEVGKVDDIGLVEEGTELVLTWSRVAIGVCEVRYSVRHYINDVLVYSVLTTENAHRLSTHFCVENIATVQSIVDMIIGEQTPIRLTSASTAHSAPEHIKTIPSLSSAIITMRANDLSKNFCPITGVRVICQGDESDEAVERIIQLEDVSSRISEFTLENLVHNTHFSCKAQWLPSESEMSRSFEFFTMDIPTKPLEISNVSSNEITVSWEVPQALERYILYFTVVITTIGPNHFVQKSCDIERNYTRSIDVPANVFTFTFTDALPNYKYHFSLTTRYNIGLDSNAELSIVNTHPGIPGPIIDLAARFVLEECARYSVDGLFIWSPPCDINGDLFEFKITLSTIYRVVGEDFIHTIYDSVLPTDADEDYNFAIKIPTLNPFFVYSVTVETVAAHLGEEPASLLHVIPPPAYSYCNK